MEGHGEKGSGRVPLGGWMEEEIRAIARLMQLQVATVKCMEIKHRKDFVN